MIHLIRHAPKAWDNGRKQGREGESHDPPLAWEKGAGEKAEELAKKLLAQEDEPANLVCSPFLRCRQTAWAMSRVFGEEQMPVVVNPLLREYLGNWRAEQVRTTEETRGFLTEQDKLVENWKEFSKRAKQAADFLFFLLNNLSDGKSVWVVTHGTMMRKLNRILEKKGCPVALHWLE